jgi:cytochrome c-type biogenesis protein
MPASESVSLFAAFLAGLVSFASPCVLPIVPGYLSFISGVNLAQLRGEGAPAALTRRVALTSVFFVLGFSTVFVALGAAATFAGELLQTHKRALGIVGGVVIIVLGLHMTGLIKIDWLLAEKRATVRQRPLGLFGAYVVGLAFAFGWTPCIGPILGAILLYASQQETVAQGVLLLAAYSAGLGIPFILSALAVNGFFRAFGRLRGSMRAIEVVSGALLVAVGILLVTDRLTLIAQYFSRAFPGLATLG